ncbi:MAG: hypothetical protein MTP17_03475 [Candidatus Midichloria sp.]|nr:MAG: hypothetical protein MTP17_03475 [Candidatus Midichloria sp.]
MTEETSKKGGILSSIYSYCPSTKAVIYISTTVGGVTAAAVTYAKWSSIAMIQSAAEAVKSGAEKVASHITGKTVIGAAAISALGYSSYSLYQYCYPGAKNSTKEAYISNPSDKQLEALAPNPTRTFHYNQSEQHFDHSMTGNKVHDEEKVGSEFDAHYKAAFDSGGAEHF